MVFGVVMKSFKMNWAKYTLDEWLVQFGAWIESCRMQTGHCPDCLQENIINKLMIESGYKSVPSHKNTVACRISDDEALKVSNLLNEMMKYKESYIKHAIFCLFKHKVEGKSLARVGIETNQSKSQVNIMVNVARGFICGRYPFLRMNSY